MKVTFFTFNVPPWTVQFNYMVEGHHIEGPMGKEFEISSVVFQIIFSCPVFDQAMGGSGVD